MGVCLATISVAHAQATYDVSTIKQAKPGENGMMLNWAHAELKARIKRRTISLVGLSERAESGPLWAPSRVPLLLALAPGYQHLSGATKHG